MEKVSVIIPAYNKAEWTAQTVDSVLQQTYPNIEVIVVDDGSKDHTRQRLSVYGDRIRYIYKDNGGACSARNEGIRQATGEFVAFLDCDDLYLEDKVAASVAYLRENPRFVFIHTAVNFIDDQNNVVGYRSHPKSRYEGWIAQRLIFENYICNSTIVVRQEALQQAGFFDESFFMPADWDMWLRLAEVGQVGFINRPLTQYRVSAHYIMNNLEKSEDEERVVIEKFFGRHPGAGNAFRKRVSSNLYLRYALAHFLKQNSGRSREQFKMALGTDPLNIKAAFLWAYAALAPQQFYSHLARKNGFSLK